MDLHIESGDPVRVDFHRVTKIHLQDFRHDSIDPRLSVIARREGGDQVTLYLKPTAVESLLAQVKALDPPAEPPFNPEVACEKIADYLREATSNMTLTPAEQLAVEVLAQACRAEAECNRLMEVQM